MRHAKRTLLAALLALLATAVAAPALAEDAAKPSDKAEKAEKNEGTEREVKAHSLDEKIRPVSGNLFLKASKVEFSPTLGMSLADAFFQKYTLGLKLDYHVVETFSIGVRAGYALDFPGSAVSVCDATGCNKPTVERMTDVPGKLGLMAGLDVAWSPIYGKLNVLAEKVLHFDTSLIAGVSGLQYQVPGGGNEFGVGLHLGVGQRYFITSGVVLRLELGDFIYSAKTVQLGDANSKLENQIMFELGLSFFLGKGQE